MNLARKLLILSLTLFTACQNQRESTVMEDTNIRVAFYNVENLFDTFDDPATQDEEFLPGSPKKWTEERYQAKLDHLAEVIAAIGYPEMIGMAEVENRQVLEDLISHEGLRDYGYDIVHYDSPDIRGIDVALLYRTLFFSPFLTKGVRIRFDSGDYQTRDILEVGGVLGKRKENEADTLYLLVNHWPSRLGGLAKSEPLRVRTATYAREIVDTLLADDVDAHVILMGDFNDEPDNKSILVTLDAKGEQDMQDEHDLFNPMFDLKKQGAGSYNFRGNWNMLDQIILSQALYTAKKNTADFHYKEGSATVFKEDWLLQQEGNYQGHPLRTYGGNTYLGGYSDHLPVYIELE